ncbi:isochorismatase family protein [Kitasatospora phosalacinea]|uniref:isochorismatase family protein n=1 Tax=Kitasatospora phosalacinea TaxID=2065 RepID=UPI0036574A7F
MSMQETSATLRTVIGLDGTPPRLADATVVLIDYQNTYREGVMALDGAEQALAAGARLLAAARAAGAPVVHVVNDGGPGTPYDIRAEIGAISAPVAPTAGEPVVVKTFPDAFHDTELARVLAGFDGDGPQRDLVLAGFMTHMCVAFTAQGAFREGRRPTVVAEACATRPLPGPDGRTVPAAHLHAAALATIGDLYGTVLAEVADLTGPTPPAGNG